MEREFEGFETYHKIDIYISYIFARCREVEETRV